MSRSVEEGTLDDTILEVEGVNIGSGGRVCRRNRVKVSVPSSESLEHSQTVSVCRLFIDFTLILGLTRLEGGVLLKGVLLWWSILLV